MLVDAAMASQLPWRNANNALDVDNSDGVTPLDALLVINRLNYVGPGKLPPPVTAPLVPPFFDTSGDNEVTAFDVLLVINHLNAASSTAGGEGEGTQPTTADPAGLPERIEFAPDWSVFGQAQADHLSPPLHGASRQESLPDEAAADDAWRVGVDRAFASDARSKPLAGPPTASSRAQSDPEELDEWWARPADASSGWDYLPSNHAAP
jgi:hypothetical protein